MRRSWRSWAVALAGLMVLGGPQARPAMPAPLVTLKVEKESVAKAAASLAQVLRAPVRVEGVRKAPVSLDVTDVSPREALDALAAAADGQWQRVYVVSGRGPGGGAGTFLSGRLVTLSLEQVSVATAAGTVARAAGARLEFEEVPDRTISVVAESEPVEAVLDRVAKAAGLVWRAEYVLTVAEPAPKAAAPAKSPTAAPRGRAPAQGRRGAPGNRQGTTRLPPGTEVRTGPVTRRSTPSPMSAGLGLGPPAEVALTQPQFIRYLFSLPRAKREPFIKDLAEELARTGASTVAAAPAASDPDAYRGASLRAQMMFERRLRRTAIVNLIRTLPPAQRRELQPIVDAVYQGMRTGTEPGGVIAEPR